MAGDLIQTPQTLWKIGSYESVKRPTLITLNGRIVNGVAESRYTQLLIPGAAAGYQVPTGKTLYITHVRCRADVADSQWLFGSATADPGANQVAAPAGAISHTSINDTSGGPQRLLTALQFYVFEEPFTFSTGRFPYLRVFTASNTFVLTALGHEE